MSKVKILQRAIDYILGMREAISLHDGVPLPAQLYYTSGEDDHLFAF